MFHVGLPLQMTPPFKGLKLFNPKSKKVFKNDFVSISLKRDISIQGHFFYVPKAFCKWKFALMVWKECQLFKRPISRFLFSQTLLIKNRQVINVGNALENRCH